MNSILSHVLMLGNVDLTIPKNLVTDTLILTASHGLAPTDLSRRPDWNSEIEIYCLLCSEAGFIWVQFTLFKSTIWLLPPSNSEYADISLRLYTHIKHLHLLHACSMDTEVILYQHWSNFPLKQPLYWYTMIIKLLHNQSKQLQIQSTAKSKRYLPALLLWKKFLFFLEGSIGQPGEKNWLG